MIKESLAQRLAAQLGAAHLNIALLQEQIAERDAKLKEQDERIAKLLAQIPHDVTNIEPLPPAEKSMQAARRRSFGQSTTQTATG